MSIRKAFSGLVAASLLPFAIPGRVDATTPAFSFGVTVVVQETCLASVNRSALEIYAHGGALVNANSAVSVTCRNPTPYDVSVSAQLHVPTAGTAHGAIAAGRAVPTGGNLPTYQDRANGRRMPGTDRLAPPLPAEATAGAQDQARGMATDSIIVTVIY